MLEENPFGCKNIGFFSLSGIADEERLGHANTWLKKWGINATIPRTTAPFRYLDGTDEERLHCFNSLLADNSLDMLVALRGGFGITRILDKIDWETMRRRDMPIVGYSDVSALHLAALNHGCCNHIHGPMLLSQMGRPFQDAAHEQDIAETMESLKKCLQGNPCPILPNATLRTLHAGTANAPIIPCNLCMLVSLLGTPHLPSLKGTILALEDICEPAYRIDRMLAQLKSAGILRQLAGLIFGDFTDCEDEQYIPEIMSEYAQYVPGPVVAGLPFGHGRRTMSIKVGAIVTLNAQDNSSVTLEKATLNLYEPHIFRTKTGTMGYRLMRPIHQEPDKKYPLILFLHGAGERGEDNTIQLKHVLPRLAEIAASGKLNAYIVAPQCPALKQWVNTPWGLTKHTMPEKMSEPMTMAMALLDELTGTLPVDTNHIYVMGISMGGYGTWDAIQRFPNKFAAAVPICGGGDSALAERLVNMPIWAFHGALDNLVPPCRTLDMIAAIKVAGGTPRMTIYENTYHDSWVGASIEPDLIPWLLSN